MLKRLWTVIGTDQAGRERSVDVLAVSAKDAADQAQKRAGKLAVIKSILRDRRPLSRYPTR